MNSKALPEESDNIAGREFSRRDFLRISGSGIIISFVPGTVDAVALQQPGRGYPSDLKAYLIIGENGRVSLL